MAATTRDLPTLPFATVPEFEHWMHEHHAADDGVWIKMAKKATGIPSVTHDEALEVALCFGWIDGQRKGVDGDWFLQKFTPRRSTSLWSKRNVDKVTRLSDAGKMQPSGQAEIDAAKADGRWDAAYDSPQNMVVPQDFLDALAANEQARTFFETLNKTNTYAIAWRLDTAKTPATRQRRFDKLMLMMERGEKIH